MLLLVPAFTTFPSLFLFIDPAQKHKEEEQTTAQSAALRASELRQPAPRLRLDDKKIAKLNSQTCSKLTQQDFSFVHLDSSKATFLALQAIFFGPAAAPPGVAWPGLSEARWQLFSALPRFSFKRNWDARKSAQASQRRFAGFQGEAIESSHELDFSFFTFIFFILDTDKPRKIRIVHFRKSKL